RSSVQIRLPQPNIEKGYSKEWPFLCVIKKYFSPALKGSVIYLKIGSSMLSGSNYLFFTCQT
ncbi:hypothetical protein, partial [Pseudomonas helleri]|uniref:hypothetical protein n=1 Tax=Pseudomonas helleri TaxID=1608996 RepID=UPI001E4E2819